jgi:hypothetical protein
MAKVTLDADGVSRLLKLPQLDTDAGPHFGKEQIDGLLKAVSAVRLREEEDLPHPPDDVGLMRGWR